MDYANIPLALFAGLFSVLSPCVLPLVPIVLGTAASEHRLGPLALAAGLPTSFTVIGLFVATIGYAMGLDGEFFKVAGAVLLLAAGFGLALPHLQTKLALAAAPLGNWTERRFGNPATAGLRGQFGVGLLLGAVWSPCVGPTLGAASVLAAQGRSLGLVAFAMLSFGLGSAVPLIVLGLVSREAMLPDVVAAILIASQTSGGDQRVASSADQPSGRVPVDDLGAVSPASWRCFAA